MEWVTYLHEAKNSPKIFDYNTKTAISELLTDAQHIANKKATEVELERIKLERKKIKLETESIRLNTEKMKLKTEEMKIGFKQDKIKRFRLSRQVMLAVGIGMIACGIALFLLLTMTGLIATGIGSIIGFIIGFIVGCAVGGGASIGIHTIATWLRNHFLGEKEKDSDENQSNHAFSPCSNQENSFESLYHTPSYPPSYSDYGPLYNPTPPCSNYGFPYNQRNFDYPTVL
ncbi:MAG: hypothetical protein LBG86_01320 [Puniceicoccales bacterium]|nr:hypothetical protein [Puniceicoccales bacterium]